MKTFWLETTDPDLVMCVPELADGEIVAIDCSDPDVRDYYEPPEPLAFDLSACAALQDEVLEEAQAILSELNPALALTGRMAITRTRD